MENATIVRVSAYVYSETIARLSQKIVDAGNRIFATIDQSDAAMSVGLSLRPTTLIVFGNPRGGTTLMQAFPLVALELPLKFLVWEEEGAKVKVASLRATEIAKRFGISGRDSLVAGMDKALESLADSITA
jgi:uncharacterized protein (DUF302 family)